MSHPQTSAGQGSDHDSHGGHDTNYVKVFMILVVLLIFSVIGPFVGEAMHMKWLTLVTAFGIAAIKAFLVIKHFMHLTIEKRVAHYILISSLACVVMLFAGTAGDVMNHRGQNWENDAAQKAVHDGHEAAKQAGDGHGETPKKDH